MQIFLILAIFCVASADEVAVKQPEDSNPAAVMEDEKIIDATNEKESAIISNPSNEDVGSYEEDSYEDDMDNSKDANKLGLRTDLFQSGYSTGGGGQVKMANQETRLACLQACFKKKQNGNPTINGIDYGVVGKEAKKCFCNKMSTVRVKGYTTYVTSLIVPKGSALSALNGEKFAIRKNNLLETLPHLYPHYAVNFQLYANSLDWSKGWLNIIHLTTGKKWCKMGCRIPAVFMHGSHGIYITYAKSDYVYNTKRISTKHWHHVEIKQAFNGYGYIYSILLDGEVVHATENKAPKTFTNVKVYAASPWGVALDGFIKDLKITTSPEFRMDLFQNGYARSSGGQLQVANQDTILGCLRACYSKQQNGHPTITSIDYGRKTNRKHCYCNKGKTTSIQQTTHWINSVISHRERSSPEHKILASKYNLLQILPHIYPIYDVDFKMYANSFSKYWDNVIHLTTGENFWNKRGSRIPIVLTHNGLVNDSSRSLYIGSAVNGQNNYDFNTKPISKKHWHHVEIKQVLAGSKYIYSMLLDGKVVHSTENKSPQTYDNVMVFVSDPWYEAFDGYIKDLKITTMKAPKDAKNDDNHLEGNNDDDENYIYSDENNDP